MEKYGPDIGLCRSDTGLGALERFAKTVIKFPVPEK
jgi:hypothetical protein